MRTFYRKIGQPEGPYETLNKTSLLTWFTFEDVFRDGFKDAIEAKSGNMSSHSYYLLMLEKKPKLKYEIMSLLKGLKEVTQCLFVPIMQPIICGSIESRALKLLCENAKRGGSKVTIAWTRHFLRCEMGWSYRSCTFAASKLPKKWEVEGPNMAYRVAYLAALYKIPPELVVNTNQIGMHLVPTCGSRIWKKKEVLKTSRSFR